MMTSIRVLRTSFFVAAFLSTIPLLGGCGRRQAVQTGTGGTTVIENTPYPTVAPTALPSPTTSPFPHSAECRLTPSATRIPALRNPMGELNVSPFRLAVEMKVDGLPVDFSYVSLNLSGLIVQQDPVAIGNHAQEGILRPPGTGTYAITMTVQSLNGARASCRTQVEVVVQNPTSLSVLIVALGAQNEDLAVLSNGANPIIHFESAGATRCAIFRNGARLDGIESPRGEFRTGVLANTGTAPLRITFRAECNDGTREVSDSVVIVVNPSPRVSFVIDGHGDEDTVRPGEDRLLRWTSQFATGGCVFSDGNIARPVAPAGQLRVDNLVVSTDFILACSDQNGHVVAPRVSIDVAPVPSVTIKANGHGGTYTRNGNEAVTLSVVARHTGNCTIDPGNGAGQGTFTYTIPASQLDTTKLYTVRCGSGTSRVTDTVNVVISVQSRTLRCDSGNYQPRTCAIEAGSTILSAAVETQYSSAPCNRPDGGKNYSFSGSQLTVNNGCRARFTIRYRP